MSIALTRRMSIDGISANSCAVDGGTRRHSKQIERFLVIRFNAFCDRNDPRSAWRMYELMSLVNGGCFAVRTFQVEPTAWQIWLDRPHVRITQPAVLGAYLGME
jgi:hypothetical protein